MVHPDIRYHTKNRIAAVDMVRLMAATFVMYEHLHDGGNVTRVILEDIKPMFHPASSLFFLLAGYFACRNITWKKMLHNSWWTLAPFVLWNSVFIIILTLIGGRLPGHNILTCFGIQSIGLIDCQLFPELQGGAWPVDGPLWFMRDLTFLFLLAPFLKRWAIVIFPAGVFVSLIPCLSQHLYPVGSSQILLSPWSIIFFTAGCLLQTFSKEFQQKALQFYSPAFCCSYLLILVIGIQFFPDVYHAQSLRLVRVLLSIWCLYQLARWIEVKSPVMASFALKYAPVTFLTFATHMILFFFMEVACMKICPSLMQTDAVLLFPLITACADATFFFALKRWCPSLLHLVAHYKLRPDDIKS